MDLINLDELLSRVRRAQQRSGYRRRLLAEVPRLSGVGGLRVLRAIERGSEKDEPPSIRDVAADLEVEHSTASRAVEDVVRRGLVAKSVPAHDQRRVHLELTERGRTSLARATQNRRVILAEVVSGWSDTDLDRLEFLLGRLADGFDAMEARMDD